MLCVPTVPSLASCASSTDDDEGEGKGDAVAMADDATMAVTPAIATVDRMKSDRLRRESRWRCR
jgi:hypothetical protein